MQTAPAASTPAPRMPAAAASAPLESTPASTTPSPAARALAPSFAVRAPSTGARPAPDGTRTAAAGSRELRSPDWVKDAIFYQVFPERFRNGDTANDPEGTVPWGSPPQNDQFFMGGDLDGVTQKFDHLTRLGVDALYLNPIFESPSNHKYDTTDYTRVDDDFGGDAAFDRLAARAKADGVKLVLDGVINHTSNEHVWFKDVREKGRESPYWEWYNVHRHPISTFRDAQGVLRTNDYEGWGKPEWGGPYATLPVLKNTRDDVMREFVRGDDALLPRWIREGKIAGWRMDVADEVEPEVWREARKEIKRANPDAYFLGENWQDASEMVAGDQFDGVMNYRYFQQPALDFFARKQISADDFARRLANPYSKEARLAMLNVLETHDTPRFITEAGGDWHRARPAAIFQMTYQGAPSIYYGAEIGMEGGRDPDSRRAFDWNLAEKMRVPAALDASVASARRNVAPEDRAGQLFAMYERLIDARKGSEALRRGDFEVLQTHNDDSTISYRRWVDGDAKDAVVAINNATTGRDLEVPVGDFAADGTSYVDALSGARHTVQAGRIDLGTVDGNWGAVLLRDA